MLLSKPSRHWVPRLGKHFYFLGLPSLILDASPGRVLRYLEEQKEKHRNLLGAKRYYNLV